MKRYGPQNRQEHPTVNRRDTMKRATIRRNQTSQEKNSYLPPRNSPGAGFHQERLFTSSGACTAFPFCQAIYWNMSKALDDGSLLSATLSCAATTEGSLLRIWRQKCAICFLVKHGFDGPPKDAARLIKALQRERMANR